MTDQPKFPLADVALKQVASTRRVSAPAWADDFWQISQTEFAMQVKGVGDFYACKGCEVEYSPAPEATLASLELFLNGSVFGAILHQRNILPMHGSSFRWNDEGIMLCGDSGAGKSALTAAFCLSGAQFLTDDVTPIVFDRDQPGILPLSDRIKLWNDSLDQLDQEKGHLPEIRPGESKFYFPVEHGKDSEVYPLHRICIMVPADLAGPELEELSGIEAFKALRNEVYRFEYLKAMPLSEISYLEKLLGLAKKTNIFRLTRPKEMTISATREYLACHFKMPVR